MTDEHINRDNPTQLTAEQYARLRRLCTLGDNGIDFSDVPEVTDRTGAKRGMFYTGPDHKLTRKDAK